MISGSWHSVRAINTNCRSPPLTPLLFEHGVDVLAGSVVVDEGAAWKVAREGGARELWNRGGLMVKLARANG